MNNLFNKSDVTGITERIQKVNSGSQKLWGTMNAAQMMAHINISMESALGNNNMKRAFIGRIIGPLMKPGVLGPKPFGKSSPTDKSHVFPTDVNFEEHQIKVINAVNRFFEGGPSKCATHPHPFFGKLSPDEWAILQWKHLDHHLRQFGA